MISWCPRCGEEQSSSDVGRLMVCWCCDEVIFTVTYDDDIDYIDLIEPAGR